ncbi:periplasmic binding protein-like I [Chytriomyces sp. MP71]|nr:periplasmic binding protein-like I [Chytriomyces sp. MP71]
MIDNTDVLGVISNEWSITANGPAEVLSYAQIPFCACESTSPRFANKNNYPYFWRTVPSVGIGEHIYQLLQYWNVHRVAILVQKDDDLSYFNGLDITSSMHKHSIRILTVFNLYTAFNNDLVGDAKIALDLVDAKYVIICGQSLFVSQTIYHLGKKGFVGPDKVWISYTTPQLYGDPISMFGSDYYLFIQGIIFLVPLPPDTNNPVFVDTYEKVQELSSTQMSTSDFTIFFILQAAYDCTMMMLLGFDHLLKSNSNFTPEMLASRQLQQYMNFTLFQDLGYKGATWPNMKLTNGGDLALPFQFQYFTGDYFNTTAFGQTTIDADYFAMYTNAAVVFHGGGTVPPPDGVPLPVTLQYGSYGATTGILCFLIVMGLVIIVVLGVFLVIFRRGKVAKSMSIFECATILLGSLLCFINMALYLIPPSKGVCLGRVWTLALGYGLSVSALVCKNIYVARVFWKKVPKANLLIWTMRGSIAFLVTIEVIILGVWTRSYKPFFVQIESDGFTYTSCGKLSSTTAVSGYNIFLTFLILPTLYLIQRVTMSQFNESITLISFFVLVAILWGISSISSGSSVFDDFKFCILVWIGNVWLLACVIGSRAFEQLIDARQSVKKAKTSSMATSAVGTSSEIQSTVSGIAASASATGGGQPVLTKKDAQKREGILHSNMGRAGKAKADTSIAVVNPLHKKRAHQVVPYRFTKVGELTPTKVAQASPWLLARIELHDLGDGRTTWLSLNFLTFTKNVLLIRGSTSVTVNQQLVVVSTQQWVTKETKIGPKPSVSQHIHYCIKFELQDESKADTLAKNLRQVLETILDQKPICRT